MVLFTINYGAFLFLLMVIDIGLQQSDIKTANMVYNSVIVSVFPYSGHKAIVTGQIDLFTALLSWLPGDMPSSLYWWL